MLTQNSVAQNEIKCTCSVTTQATADYFLHCHSHYEIYYILSGDISYLAEGSCYQPVPDSLMVFPPNLFHGMKVLSTQPYRRYTLYFHDSVLPVELKNFLLAIFPSGSDAAAEPLYYPNVSSLNLEPLFSYLIDCEQMDSAYRDAMSSVYLQALLGRLTFLTPAPAAHTHTERSGRIPEILQYINDHLEEPLSLDHLSGRFFISKNYLNVLFRETTGTTIGDYLINKRVIRARQLLFDGCRVSDAAAMVGFSDYSAFFRAYKKILGHRPSQDKGNPQISTVQKQSS